MSPKKSLSLEMDFGEIKFRSRVYILIFLSYCCKDTNPPVCAMFFLFFLLGGVEGLPPPSAAKSR